MDIYVATPVLPPPSNLSPSSRLPPSSLPSTTIIHLCPFVHTHAHHVKVHIPCSVLEYSVSSCRTVTGDSLKLMYYEHVHIPCLEHEFEHLGIINSHPYLGVTITTMHMHKHAYKSTSTRGIVCPPPPTVAL